MAADTDLPVDLSATVARLDELVSRFEQHPEPAVQDHVFELLRCVDGMHRPGVRALGALLRKAGLLRRALDDPEIKLLLDVYDVGEGGEQARVEAVLTPLREAVRARGGDLAMTESAEGRITVRLSGAFASDYAGALREAIQQTLQQDAPAVAAVDVQFVDPPRPRAFVPAGTIGLAPRGRSWRAVARLDEVPAAGICLRDVDGHNVLLTRVDDDVRAYDGFCPGTPFPLAAAAVTDGILLCPIHGCRFELRSGKRLDWPGPDLNPIGVRLRDGEVLMAEGGAAA